MVNLKSISLIVNKPEHLTRKWAQAVVNHQTNPQLKNTEIQGVELISVDVGTTTRVRLKVDHNRPMVLPKRWFVKLPSSSWRARTITALPRLLSTEVRFYNEIAQLIPVDKPKVLAAQSYFGKGSTLVLNDVSDLDAIAGRVGDALSFEQANLVVEQLANFHSHFVDKVNGNPAFRWLAGPVRGLEDRLGTALAVPLMRRGLKVAGDVVPARLHNSALRYAHNRKRVMQFLSQATPTLVHHDCHPGNLFWYNDQPGFLDWQMVRIGEGISDVSYFLATALTPETRRMCEMKLLMQYHANMVKKTQTMIDFNQLLNRYRSHLVYPFEAMVLTLAIGGMMTLNSNLEMIRRAAAAVEDHDAFAILPNMA